MAARHQERAGVRQAGGEDMAMGPRLCTIGYEQHRTSASLVAALKAAGIRRLLDVRELPLSRRRGFSKTALGAVLGDADVSYEHERALGNPKPLRDLYRSGRQSEGEAGYLAHIRNGSAWAVDELAISLEREPTCILCFEEDHRQCHRALIVDELRLRLPHLRVEHL
jgi:uncharacterized protein (DUF488 family)